MSKAKTPDSSSSPRKIRPAISPEARDNQLIALAYNLVEKRLLEGTASSQETTHFLKLGSARETQRVGDSRITERADCGKDKEPRLDARTESSLC